MDKIYRTSTFGDMDRHILERKRILLVFQISCSPPPSPPLAFTAACSNQPLAIFLFPHKSLGYPISAIGWLAPPGVDISQSQPFIQPLNISFIWCFQELKAASEHLQGIIAVAMATLVMKDVQHPQQMFETALVLHGGWSQTLSSALYLLLTLCYCFWWYDRLFGAILYIWSWRLTFFHCIKLFNNS